MPSVSLPKGGGAIRGIGEKFAVSSVTGTGSLTVPIAASPGRSGFGPQLSLSYDSGAGNGPFGFGWSLAVPSITRKTDKGLPRYCDADESDVFILSGSEDLVPVLDDAGGRLRTQRTVKGIEYDVHAYRPRIEGLFARIERWVALDTGISHWRSITRDNVTTLFGLDAASRIADPADPRKIFSYRISRTFDDKGNASVYEYVTEDGAGIDRSTAHEMNRDDAGRAAQNYLKRIRYGNAFPYYPDWSSDGEAAPLPEAWHFEVVMDYGDHSTDAPTPAHDLTWAVRPDPFSTYRAGFEVRTYRRCERVLVFHHFADEPGVGENCLVRSTDFAYSDESSPADPRNPIYTFLQSVTQTGYRRDGDGYRKKSMPPLEFEYSQPQIRPEVLALDRDSLANLPEGLDGSRYRWVDLDGEGLSGILSDVGGAWGYKRNLSPLNETTLPDGSRATRARFGLLELVTPLPSRSGLAGAQQLLDLSGDGQLDVVAFDGAVPGFFERTQDESWDAFQPFVSLPRVNWSEPNLKFVDLTGDGLADVLITEDGVFTFHASLGESGFGEAQRIATPWDEERGPHVVLADGTQTIFLADMKGDGLSDIVRVRNGEVCYWPNLGYGRFGAKVAMDTAPRFASDESFDPRRVRLADIDGSGTSDLLYIGYDGLHVCFNRSGNSWAAPRRLAIFPAADDLSAVQVTDLLGNGTACLVWSSPLPAEAPAPLRYVDLMGGEKPHLMIRSRNNLGAETRVRYVPSTRFYLADKFAGRPWITRLAHLVHVVERVETYDWIGRSRFVTRYAYHHGYFDGFEREFRGFGMVEQWDTETHREDTLFPDVETTNEDAASFVPPILTRTWFHTGALAEAGMVSRQYTQEYWVEPALRGDAPAAAAARESMLLPDTVMDPGLGPVETREAYRALKGSPLRIEIYSEDETAQAQNPYSVSERNYTVALAQPCGPNRHAVLFLHARETIDYHYERGPAEPRVSHALTLEVDGYGNILKTVSIGYGRRVPDAQLDPQDQAKQGETLVTCNESRVTDAVDASFGDGYRTPLPCETRAYHLTGYMPTGSGGRYQASDFVQPGPDGLVFDFDGEIQYHEAPGPGRQRRLIKHARTLYRRNDMAGPLPLRTLDSLALPFESYTLAFTPGLVTAIYGARTTNAMFADEGRYVHSEGDENWWIPSGRAAYSPGSGDSPAQELAFARAHFFLPHRHRDPFHSDLVGTESFVAYDRYCLLIEETRDALGNRITAGERDIDPTQPLVRRGLDYRVLQPALTMDPNRNRVAVSFDTLGMVVGTAAMGKPEDHPRRGDLLDGFDPDLSDAAIAAHLLDPFSDSQALIQRAATRVIYDAFAYLRTRDDPRPQPTAICTLARHTHDADLADGETSRIQHTFVYSDGFGREIQKKLEAEPGPVPKRDGLGNLVLGPDLLPEMTAQDKSPRWAGSGWMIFNNKGNPVRQYEPFFSETHGFEFDVRIGVSPTLFYDPAERGVATLNPNHTWKKVDFDPWRQMDYDANDTLTLDPRTDPDAGGHFARLPDADYLPGWHTLRTDPAFAAQAAQRWPDPVARQAEAQAAASAAIHVGTPTVAHFDCLGRVVLAIAHNRFKRSDTPAADPPIEEFYVTRTVLDIDGNQREIVDAKGRVVMRYDYDMLGNRVHQASMEAGERWMLADVAGKSIRAWDGRGHAFKTEYDPLRRPVRQFVRGVDPAGSDPRTLDRDVLFERTEYGEAKANDIALNLRTRVFRRYDNAGVVTSEAYDFKGNQLSASRALARDYKELSDWSTPVPMDGSVYPSSTTYDALNRPVALTAPDASVVRPAFNEANLLDRVDVNLRGEQENGAPKWTSFVRNIDYDAKGQRQRIEYGNDAVTVYEYDPLTFRLARLKTSRPGARFPDDCPDPPQPDRPGCAVQNLRYTFDPVGNLSSVRDDAQQTVYFRNKRVEPSNSYVYDAIYRLIEANGREHLGQNGGGAPLPPSRSSYDDGPRTRLLHPGDGNAMGRYVEQYVYDEVGNFLEMIHRGADPVNPGWTRSYDYDDASQLQAARRNNRLTGTVIGADAEVYSVGGDGYDAHGNMLRMPQLQVMRWDFKDQLFITRRQAVNADDEAGAETQGERTYYVYDAGGQRVRKVTELATGNVKEERTYLGGFEIYRRQGVNALVRETLHVMDGNKRVALVETRTQGDESGLPVRLIRYQLANHLGSAALELGDLAQVLSYEEYFPYGSTSFQAVRNQTEAPKRFRFLGKERDEESGLYYNSARYYAPWLGRWTASDRIGLGDGVNTYSYVNGRPTIYRDPTGAEGDEVCGVYDEEEMVCRAETCQPVSPTPVIQATPRTTSHPATRIRAQPRREPAASTQASPPPASQASPSSDLNLGGAGLGLIYVAPEGFTLVVPTSYDAQKMGAYREGVLNGEIGRNGGREAPTSFRRNSQVQVDAREQFTDMFPMPTDQAPGGRGWARDHIIELQHDLTGESGNAPLDYRWQDSALNSREGSQSWALQRDNPFGVPAGGVARLGTEGRWYNTEGFREGVRGGGEALLVLGVIQTADHLADAVEADIQDGTGGRQTARAAATESGGWAGACYGGELGGELGLLCGEAAPICSPVGALVLGGIGYHYGSEGVDQAIDAIPSAEEVNQFHGWLEFNIYNLYGGIPH